MKIKKVEIPVQPVEPDAVFYVELTKAEAEALAEMTTQFRHPASPAEHAATESGQQRYELRVNNPCLYEFYEAVTGYRHPNK